MFILPILMAVLARQAGGGLGAQHLPDTLTWVPEAVFSLIITLVACAVFYLSGFTSLIFGAISYLGMQAATWMYLRWRSHDDPNTERESTLKPVVDFIAGKFGYSLGDEGYAWIAAGVKGFLITLPVGGVGAVLWPLGYEIGSHAQGRVEKYGIDPHSISELASGALIGIWLALLLGVT